MCRVRHELCNNVAVAGVRSSECNPNTVSRIHDAQRRDAFATADPGHRVQKQHTRSLKSHCKNESALRNDRSTLPATKSNLYFIWLLLYLFIKNMYYY
jgi:hypothetical protein